MGKASMGLRRSTENAQPIPRDPVPMRFWGKDHWSTFAYLCTRIVGTDGQPDKDKMRTDPERHPGLSGPAMARLHAADPTRYPTRLLGDATDLPDHDDWDCAEDAEAAGLLEWGGTGLFPVFALTPLGWKALAAITAHKAGGGTFAEFVFVSEQPPAGPSASASLSGHEQDKEEK